MSESFLPQVEEFIAQAQETRQAKINLSADQFQYFWSRLEHVIGADEVGQYARAYCPTCGQDHLLSELLHLTRLGDKRTGKCGHLMTQLMVTWKA